VRREFLGAMGGLLLAAVATSIIFVRRFRLQTWLTHLRSGTFAWLLFIGTASFVSLSGRASIGGNLNNLMIGYALLCLSPVLLAHFMRRTNWLLMLILLQFGLSLFPPMPYTPQAYWPTAEMQASGDQLIAFLSDIEGEVLIMLHPHYAQLADKTPGVHVQTLWHARLRGSDPLPPDFEAQIESQRFAVIISDESAYFETEPQLKSLLEMYYVAHPLDAALSPPTLSGIVTRPLLLYTPKFDIQHKFMLPY